MPDGGRNVPSTVLSEPMFHLRMRTSAWKRITAADRCPRSASVSPAIIRGSGPDVPSAAVPRARTHAARSALYWSIHPGTGDLLGLAQEPVDAAGADGHRRGLHQLLGGGRQVGGDLGEVRRDELRQIGAAAGSEHDLDDGAHGRFLSCPGTGRCWLSENRTLEDATERVVVDGFPGVLDGAADVLGDALELVVVFLHVGTDLLAEVAADDVAEVRADGRDRGARAGDGADRGAADGAGGGADLLAGFLEVLVAREVRRRVHGG